MRTDRLSQGLDDRIALGRGAVLINHGDDVAPPLQLHLADQNLCDAFADLRHLGVEGIQGHDRVTRRFGRRGRRQIAVAVLPLDQDGKIVGGVFQHCGVMEI